MINLRNITKVYHTRKGPRTVLRDVNLIVARGQKIGILGRNGAGKSTLIRLISGAELPTSGELSREMSISWPLAFTGAFQGSLTGLDNVRFICRIYNIDFHSIVSYVEEFSELGVYLNEPVKKYSSGMRARLAFAASLAINFDCFLIDEIVAVGDSRFHAKCHHELFERRKDRAMIIVSHDVSYIRDHCDSAAVLLNGELVNFPTVDEALNFYMHGAVMTPS
ncbi:ATP-binding protein [Burkholderia cenocepacia]|uniref:ABC transporter ATP-binding protein n=1 Tax=Burkholderia cenocepacia TaxID=95486 RepID=UPI00075E3246|nr:ABC transporter ATP-binding protein [Burkholderia cenocepacia]KWF17180.1 ATP-binding protein [Burkholderia cenocepacia]MBJ9898541.1 ABC transporter ATP-binding protein [Burkholderia cenocepacia]MBJ9913161.1 ABC transporter ATP-binding protein [Burkholderia cenocepacia]MBR8100096.1 ABC transporter ATP-binding protein [Burkholderia cenocepacia]MBR8271325.1 ABC transporter ATP-binding protein [Burkholderia cenocepacia]